MLAPADADIVRREIAIPGLRALLDPNEFAAMLGKIFPGREIGEVMPRYVRYRPGTNCLAVYKVEVAGESVDVYARALRRVDLGNLRKIAGRLGAAIWEDRAVIVMVFPIDEKLEVLPRLVDDEWRGLLLSEFMRERPDLWEGTIQTMRYKPERRFLAKFLVGSKPTAVLKVYNYAEYAGGESNARLFQSGGSLRVAGLLGGSERHRILVFEWLPGENLGEVIQRPEPSLQPVRLTGAALAELHARRVDGLPPITRERETARLLAAGEMLGVLCPHLARRAGGIARKLAARLAEEPQLYLPIHGDFKAQQVLVDGDTVTVVDFDHAVGGDPSSDLGLFLARLEKEALHGVVTGDRLEAVKNALLEGYRQVAGDIPERVELYTAIRLLSITARRFRHREPGWPEESERLLERVAAILHNSGGDRIFASSGHEHSVLVTDVFRVTDDPAMPFLAGALRPEEALHQLEAGVPHLFTGKYHPALRAIRVTRHRHGRRCVIEYDLEMERDDAPPQLCTLLGKVRAQGTDELTWLLVMSLWNRGFGAGSHDAILVPEPLGVVPAFRMWLQRKVPGVTVTNLLAGPDGVDVARRVAEAAHKLHLTGVPSPRSHTMADELRILHERLPEVAEAKPEWRERIHRLLALCDRLGEGVPEPKTTGIHRDFYPDNLMVDGPRLYILDFDLYCNGDPGLDIGNFLGHMTEYALRVLGNPMALAESQEALIERFIELSGEEFRASVDAYAVLTLVRHIHLSTQFLPRRPYTGEILELTEQRLEALVGSGVGEGGG